MTTHAWSWLRRHICPKNDEEIIVKVQRVVQRADNRVRFDLWVRKECWEKVQRAISAHLPATWRFKRSVCWKDRPARSRPVPKSTPVPKFGPQRGSFNMMSLNIRGANRKRQELDLLLHNEAAKVLCLQETLLPQQGWILRFKGYQTYQVGKVDGEGGKGKLGLTTLVSRAVPSYLLHASNNGQALWVRCFPTWAPAGVVIGNIYIGHTPRRSEVLTEEVMRYKTYSSQWPTVIMGDWNNTVTKVETIFSRLGADTFRPAQPAGKTFYRQHRPISAIDFALYDAQFASLGMLSQRVLRTYTLSDHAVYRLSLKPIQNTRPKVETPITRVNGTAWWDDATSIALSNRWDSLKDDIDNGELSLDEVSSKFMDTTIQVCREVGRVSEASTCVKPQRKLTYTLPRRIVVLYKQAGLKRKRAMACTSPEVRERLHKEVTSELRVARAKTREFSKSSWFTHVTNTTHLLVNKESKKWWRLTKEMITGNQSTCPVRDDAGELVVAGEPLQQAWNQHFKRLVTDSAGSSRNPEAWEHLEAEDHGEIPGINTPFTWPELARCLRTSRSGRAPGASGIPVEIFKACALPGTESEAAELETETNDTTPPNKMAECLLWLCNNIWEAGKIPAHMLEKWFVAVPKKGDLTDRNNYRGIVLMDTVLKVMSRMLTQRTSCGLETGRRLIDEQGGFRPGREVVTQVISLLEVMHRRTSRKKGGFLLFVDLVKAFDRVPHEALFKKLWHMGVRGKSLDFLRAEYAHSRMRVRTQSGLSQPFDQELGVHQGGPFSPVGFGVYINDILDKLTEAGCRLDGITRKFIGLLFADDMVLILRNRTSLKQTVARLEDWAAACGMSFGVKADGSKTAILPFGAKARRQALNLKVKMTGDVIPVVGRYMYLGVPITGDISHIKSNIREHALQKAERAFRCVKHILGCSAFPTMTRVMLLHNVVVNSAMFGTEIWGGILSRCTRFDSLMAKGLKLCFGYQENARGVPTHALAIEAGIAPFIVKSTVARLRLFYKISQGKKDNWLKILIDSPPHSGNRRGSWVWETQQIIQRLTREFGSPLGLYKPLDLAELAKQLWLKYESQSASTLRVRELYNLYPHRPWTPLREWLRLWSKFGGDARIERGLWRLRSGTFWTAPRLVKIGWLPSRFKDECPCCKEKTPETIDHYLFVCKKWADARKPFVLRAEYLFPGIMEDANRTMGVLGRHPVSLSAVNLAEAEANAEEPWEVEHTIRRGWIRARGPLWGFLVATLQERKSIWKPFMTNKSSVFCDPRVDALAVGQAYCTATDVAGGPGPSGGDG